MWRLNDPQCNESSKIRWEIVPYTRGQGLDIGCGKFKTFPHFTGVDSGHHWGTDGVDLVTEADDLSLIADDRMDFVFSSHTLEHMVDVTKTLKEWWRVIKPGGYLVLYLPHADLYPNCGEPGANADHKHDFKPEHICAYMDEVSNDWVLIQNQKRDNDYGPGSEKNEYSFFQVYQKTANVEDVSGNKIRIKSTSTKSACVVRYGGFGDMLQAANVFPGLKKQGYHVTVMTTPKGKDILKHDPNIDEFFIQDDDQVPNHLLGLYWDYWRAKYDRFINLSMTVEGSLLVMPSDFRTHWPKEAIHQACNINYLEFTAKIAGVPMKRDSKFYPSAEEAQWVGSELAPIADKEIILWSLSGSSLHKVSPWVDYVVARLLSTYKDVHIIFVGDDTCKILEGNSWDNEPRVWCRSGEYTIRQTLALARDVDIVVGPETGVLNSVAFESLRKVCILSHSTKENLTKHWKNTVSLAPNVPCYPCHKLHYGEGTCPYVDVRINDNVETMASCVADIDNDKIYTAIRDILRGKRAA